MDPSLHRKNEQLKTAMAWDDENHERAMMQLANLLRERRRIAKFVIDEDMPERKNEWLASFNYLNDQIKKLLGL